ncbi:MAG: aminotransferase class III-fold pyridoxal phosphate-dependent enzyme [Aestuariivirga sp.]|uniref:aminotransferase class III-fold pyridoxal phosphate-dependent enzyme n=1 Tax=Aestuariivirga sp. TaxID=2650926 RepID=UPI0025B95123|nr:aminotransferase class III-fold pyridoxal phosphate-dependent enzyme [Aestuariivirga sp.]MCA3561907.1 aminotransferase class III-fold pyridoxal phosphate-dependent enzyme [Aestuariivirga sp.]
MNQISVFDSPKPAFSPEEARHLLARDYGIDGTLKDLVSERDQNFLVDSPAGKFVLKIANALEDHAFLALQNAAMKHVAQADPTLGLQRVIAANSGDGIVRWENGTSRHAVRLLSYLPGELYSAAGSLPALLASLGAFMGRLSRALKGFSRPAAFRPGFLWNLDEAMAVKPWLPDIVAERRGLVARIFARYESRVLPRLPLLRGAVLHQDANDNNIVVDASTCTVTGLIDFGDMTHGRQINELAVTLAYALLDVEDVYKSAAPLISAYAQQFPIEAEEADILFDLLAARLAMSVCISSHRAKDFPDNGYLLVSQAPAFRLLDRLDKTNPNFLAAFTRQAAGLAPVPASSAVVQWLASPDCRPHPIFDIDLDRSGRILLELQEGAPGMEHASDAEAYWSWIESRFRAENAQFAIGLYGEVRNVYKGEQFASAASPEWRAQHLGQDIFIAAGTPLYAPLPGKVLSVADNALPYDYGPTVILEHRAGETGPVFWTLYGHLSRETLGMVKAGQEIAAGQQIATIGDRTVNGGWAPHLHFQIITDRLGQSGEFPGVGQPSLWPIWRAISPDPNLILRLAPESFSRDATPPEVLLKRRQQVLGPSLSINYRKKLKIVRGRGAYLYDHTGRAFLDGVNNICHVGHSHPHVVDALARQAAILNTNTRYLHDTILDYAERLGSYFPRPLSVVYFVCSGSEANELALRMARTVTGRRATITLDWGYHGNTNGLIDVSPYKFNRKGGRGKPDYVEIAELADPYRGRVKGTGENSGIAYAASVAEKVELIRAKTGQGPAAFIAEAISGCGGQVFFPQAYLRTAAEHVRKAGGLVIVDEVQTGFGRVGNHMWAHGPQGVVPDIVTLGKPIGNGHPMAAVVTTPEIAKAFANGMEFFSSFGGNPVSAAAGMAVLDVLEQEGLQQKARITGDHLKARFHALAERYPLIGDVRGEGLFLGVELVQDRETLEPATDKANLIANDMRNHGVLISTDGPFDNVLKIKPPMAFGLAEADIMADALDAALGRI